jgi:hypothetical protein
MEDYRLCTQISSHININQNNSGQKAVFETDFLWPKNRVITIGFIGEGEDIKRTYYNFWSEVDPLQYKIQNGSYMSTISIIQTVVNERIQPLVNLTFNFLKKPYNRTPDIRISFDKKDGCFSAVGKDALNYKKEDATMNFAWLDVSTILHEFGHAIGMNHEHQSPYSSIKWNKPVLYLYYWLTIGWDTNTVDENVINKFDKKNNTGSKFDPLSIMLYYYPSILTTDFVGTSENNRLSGYDVEWISKTYSKKDGISPEKFYYDTYGITLASSKEESDKLAKSLEESEGLAWWKILLIVISIIIVIIIIAVLIKNFYKNNNHSYENVVDRNIPRANIPLIRRNGGIMGIKRD